jgi:L-fucose isomerase-like protein
MTRYGAVETYAEGRAYAKFLEAHKGEYDGVVLALPNFGDENGASEGLRDCGVPIYILAYPDELDKMDFSLRRDAFCGKFSIMDVFHQYQIPFTAWIPHALHPTSPVFAEHMRQFAAVCRIVKGMKRFRIGGIGARPTLFKTIRFDETTLQKYGVTTEVFDNSDLLIRMNKIASDDPELKAKMQRFRDYSNFSVVPESSLETLSRISVAIDRLVEEYELDGIGLRCWSDLQLTAKISPCVILSELNDRGIVAACEMDVCNAMAMHALNLASQEPAACLDWNNNYGDDPDKCILFHCGSIPQKLMTEKGNVIPHKMFAKGLGEACSHGANVGFIKAMDFSFVSTMTADGKLFYYSGEGKFTGEPLGEGFFGCGGSAYVPDLQKKLNVIGYAGYRHHVSVTPGLWTKAIDEAFLHYLNYNKTEL